MTFSLPTIDYQFATGDTNYISRFNDNFQQISNAFIGARNDINVLNNQQGVAVRDDWIRKSVIGDPDGGILGPRSFVIGRTAGSPADTITLSPQNADGYSYAYISGERRSTTETLSVTPPSNTTQTRYIGLNADALTGNLTVEDTTNPNTPNLTIYKYAINNGTVSNFRRMPRTLLMSNTLEQLKQETPNLLHIQLAAPTGFINNTVSSNFNDAVKFTIPYDHVWTGGVLHLTNNSVTGANSYIHITDFSGNDIMEVTLIANGTNIDFTVKADYVDKIMAAGTDYSIGVDVTGGSISNPSVTLNFLQSFNVPVV